MSSSTHSNDEDLARRAQAGCMASFEELVRRHQVPLVHFLRQTVGTDAADDLAQDTFLRAYENLHRYNGSSRFGTWLFTIGRRLGLNANRRIRSGGEARLPKTVEGNDPAPPQVAAEREHHARLWKAAATLLSEPEYAAVWLHYVEGMATAEVGRVLGRSRVAVKTMLFRCRRKLIDALAEPDPADRRRTHKAATAGRTP